MQSYLEQKGLEDEVVLVRSLCAVVLEVVESSHDPRVHERQELNLD